MDNLSPTFVKSVRVDYFFEEVQLLRFQVLPCGERELRPLGTVFVPEV